MGYTSQQSTLLNTMIAHLQDSTNWVDGEQKVTDFTPGSVAYTMLAAHATGSDLVGYQLYTTSQQAAIETATGPDLDARGKDWGVPRKSAISAHGPFTVTKNTSAAKDLTIPKGILITTFPATNGSTIKYTTDAAATLTAGSTSVSVQATCSTSGASGNLSKNTQLLIGSAVPGIDGVQLDADITNGTNSESDDDFRGRILDVIQNPEGGGTANDYKTWAMSVSGVTSCIVLPLNRGAGTVDIVITSGSTGIPDETLIQAVQAVIDAKKPIGADARVVSPTAVTIDITAAMTIDTENYTISGLIPAITAAITNYILSVSIGGTAYNSGLVSKVVAIAGVKDCIIGITVGGTSYTNYTLPALGKAIAGTITVS